MANTRASSAKMGGPRATSAGSNNSAALSAVNLTLAELKAAIDELKVQVANINAQN